MKERVHVFIDGSNLYHRLVELLGHARLGNYSHFLEGLMNKNQELVGATYYIGKINSNTGATPKEKSRSKLLYEQQEKFLGWLKECGIEYKLGYFQTDGKTEKGVDVKIAVDMIKFAYENKYDTAFLISGDGDLVDAVDLVKTLNKTVYNLIFYKQNNPSFSYRLRKACDKYFYINKQIEKFIEKS